MGADLSASTVLNPVPAAVANAAVEQVNIDFLFDIPFKKRIFQVPLKFEIFLSSSLEIRNIFVLGGGGGGAGADSNSGGQQQRPDEACPAVSLESSTVANLYPSTNDNTM